MYYETISMQSPKTYASSDISHIPYKVTCAVLPKPEVTESKNILFSHSELIRLVFNPNVIKCCIKYASTKRLLKYKLSTCITQKLPSI